MKIICIFILLLCSQVVASTIALIPMTQVDFESYFEGAIDNYARELEQGGVPKQLATIHAEEDFIRLLPLGKDSPNQFVMSIVNEELNLKVGALFYEVDSEGYFINDFVVYEPYRNKGYGTLALLELESIARMEGIKAISLHVFNHNQGARRVYERLGYIEVDSNKIQNVVVGHFLEKNLD